MSQVILRKASSEKTEKTEATTLIEKRTPQRINYSWNKLKNPVITSRQLATNTQVKWYDYPQYASVQKDISAVKKVVKPNYDLENALKFYYQKVSPSQWRIASFPPGHFVPIEGVSLSIHQRKDLYASSFKKAKNEYSKKMLNSSQADQIKVSTEFNNDFNYEKHSRTLPGAMMGKSKSKNMHGNNLWVFGNNHIAKRDYQGVEF